MAAKGGVGRYDDLLSLFGDPAHPLAGTVAAWGEASPRFAAFAEAHRDKIRKKARGARDAAALDDLLLELAVARDLHRERHAAIAYEPRVPGRTREPDFAVTLRSGATVMVEVTRIRPGGAGAAAPPGAGGEAAAAGALPGDGAAGTAVPPGDFAAPLELRLMAAICGKFGQLVPNVPNLVVAGVSPDGLPGLDLAGALRALVARAEARALAPRERYDMRTPGDFFRSYGRLSGLLVRPWPPGESAGAGVAIPWLNARAGKPLPPRFLAPFLE